MVSGRVFGMFHLTNPDATLWAGIAIAIGAGLFLGVSYALTRSLWVVIGYHMLWNIVQGPVLGVQISGTGKASSIWHTGLTGPEWLTGGSFGLEASVVTVILLLAATVVLALMLRRRGGVAAPGLEAWPVSYTPPRLACGPRMIQGIWSRTSVRFIECSTNRSSSMYSLTAWMRMSCPLP